ncbi:helix-turn-helix domain-containing protein [Paraburkholderia mimosarum]|uniref:helix-turn-helix domain-containing protein n=1 Tax=Paraburkholderia mimosarum TaxID=312026 RepID=UPI0012DEE6C0
MVLKSKGCCLRSKLVLSSLPSNRPGEASEQRGGWLGLETASRLLSRLRKDGMIRAPGKQVQILDHDGLHSI